MHTESEIQGNNSASHRGGNTVWLRQSNIVSHKDGEKPNAERTVMPSNRLATHIIGHFSPKRQTLATCVATSQRLAVTTEQVVTT